MPRFHKAQGNNELQRSSSPVSFELARILHNICLRARACRLPSNVAIRKDIDFIDGSLKSTEIAMQEKKRISITCSRTSAGRRKIRGEIADLGRLDGWEVDRACIESVTAAAPTIAIS